MNAWPFVIAAWTLTLVASAMIAVLSWRAMRRAESDAESLRR